MVDGVEKGSTGNLLTWKGNEAITGNATVGGTLGVTGNTTVGGTLGVTGNTSITGTLAVTGTTAFTGGITIGGSGTSKTKKINLTAAAMTAATNVATDTGWDIPAGAIVRNCYFYLTTKDTGALTMCIGTNSATYDNFLNTINLGVSATNGTLITGYPTLTTTGTNIDRAFYNDNCVGAALAVAVPGVDAADKTQTAGFFIPIPAYFATATSLFYKLSATASGATGTIIIVYDE
jgi:hypothetical protein